jgi:hypothetical protein
MQFWEYDKNETAFINALCYAVESRKGENYFVIFYRAHDISICELQNYNTQKKLFKTDYLCVLFMTDGVKDRPRCIIRKHVRLEMNSAISRGI